MPDRALYIAYPGLLGGISCSYTCSHGTAPGTVTITAQPQNTPPATLGDLEFGDGVGAVRLTSCRLVSPRMQRSTGGATTMTYMLLDRRWKWAYGKPLGGEYNVRQGDSAGTIDPDTLKSLPDLIRLCFEAMGETRYSITLPPVIGEDFFPYVSWSYANAAEALQSLIAPLGCRIAFDTSNDGPAVVPLGMGRNLPNGSISSESPEIELRERPDRVVLVGDAVYFEAAFHLEPVGVEPDGRVVPIDDLSYAPENGWGTIQPLKMKGVQETDLLTEEEAETLAQRDVWSLFRIRMLPVSVDPDENESQDRDEPIEVPGLGQVVRRNQIVLLPSRAATEDSNVDGPFAPSPARVYGSVNVMRSGANAWLSGSAKPGVAATDGSQNTNISARLFVPFSIDSLKGLVRFGAPLYRIKDGMIKPPILRIWTACHVRDRFTGAIASYEEIQDLGQASGAGDAVVRNPELKLKYTTEYDPLDFTHRTPTNNANKVRPVARMYLAGAAAAFQPAGRLTRTYNGIVQVVTDGAIQQVSYSLGPSGATTTASLNGEHSSYVPRFNERMLLRRRTIEQAEKVDTGSDTESIGTTLGRQQEFIERVSQIPFSRLVSG